MSSETISISATSCWSITNQKDLRDAVTTVPLSAAKREEDGSLTDMVELDSCVHLAQPEEKNGNNDSGNQSCSITLKLETPFPSVVVRVIVVCEARMVEVYGAFSEYLMTVSAELLDEVDDTAVYCADIKLSQLTQECTLKFARLTRASDMWLYGIKVIWNPDLNLSICNKSRLNFESVEQRLTESDKKLSDRAQSCKQFLKMYSSFNEGKGTLDGFPDPASLISLLPSIRRQRQTGSFDNSFVKHAAQQFQNASTSSSLVDSDKQSPNEYGNPICDRCFQELESVLGKQLVSMENRIMKALDEKMTALQLHQDRQIQNLSHLLLESRLPGRSRDKIECTSSTLLNQDLKMEQAIKTIMGPYSDLSSKNEPKMKRSLHEGAEDTNILRNALKAMQLNEMFTSSTCSNGVVVDSNNVSVVQNSL